MALTYYQNQVQQKQAPSTTGSYNNALDEQQGDYDYGMNKYRSLLDNYQPTRQLSYSPINYQESGDTRNALSNLADLSSTGGYNAQNIADIRSRGISPIRSIYSSAGENLDRQRSLAGGFSPNYNAVAAKMARDKSNQIAQAVTNVNATLAQNIAQNRLSAAPQYASAAGAESQRGLGADEFNRTNQQDVAKTNANLGSTNLDNQLHILGGMNSLYGTTPALASTFGDQALRAAQINSTNQNASAGRVAAGRQSLVGMLPRGRG